MWTYNYLSHANTNRASVEKERNVYRAEASANRKAAQNVMRLGELMKVTKEFDRTIATLRRYDNQILQLSSEMQQLFNQLSKEAVRYDQGSPSLSKDQIEAKYDQLYRKANALNTAIFNLSNILSRFSAEEQLLSGLAVDLDSLRMDNF